jgi:hypothetical protein
MEAGPDESFEALLRYMRDSRGSDFTGYKHTSLSLEASAQAQAGPPRVRYPACETRQTADEQIALTCFSKCRGGYKNASRRDCRV